VTNGGQPAATDVDHGGSKHSFKNLLRPGTNGLTSSLYLLDRSCNQSGVNRRGSAKTLPDQKFTNPKSNTQRDK